MRESLLIEDAVSDGADPSASGRHFGVVGHHYDGRLAVTDDLGKMIHDLVTVFSVQLAGGFIRQDDLRLVDQGACHCHPLALAAG